MSAKRSKQQQKSQNKVDGASSESEEKQRLIDEVNYWKLKVSQFATLL